MSSAFVEGWDRVSSVGISIRYGLDGRVIESLWGGEIFRNRPDRPLGPPSLLRNRYRFAFPGVKQLGRVVDHQPPFSAEVEGRIQLYICSPSWVSWSVLG